jgi:hypothetical protein
MTALAGELNYQKPGQGGKPQSPAKNLATAQPLSNRRNSK